MALAVEREQPGIQRDVPPQLGVIGDAQRRQAAREFGSAVRVVNSRSAAMGVGFVALAVKRSALQTFREFTVAFEQVGDAYEVRMLELGRQDETWAEVLGGLQTGATYVTDNSYLIKADIEKSGASHDH